MSLRRAFTNIIGPVALAAILFIGNVASAANCCLINTVVRMSAGVVEDEQACKDLARSLQYTYVPNASPSEDTQQCIEAGGLDESTPTISNPLDNPELSVKIPGLTLSDSTCDADGCSTPWLADYIQGLYQYGIGAIAILAVIGLMIGGILWTTSAGNQERVGDARKWVGGSLMGVLISVTAYTVLTIINPALIELSPIKVAYIPQTVLEELPDEALTLEYTDDGLPQTNLGTGQGQFKLPILYQGRFKSYNKGYARCGCGPAALTMVLNYYGVDVTVPQIAEAIRQTGNWNIKNGTDEKGAKRCSGFAGIDGHLIQLKKYGIKYKMGKSFEDIKTLIKDGPVIVSVHDNGSEKCIFTKDGHYVVITGYSDGKYFINDPNEYNKGKTGVVLASTAFDDCQWGAGVIGVSK